MLIWKKSEPKVFNWSEFYFFEVTFYKIHILVNIISGFVTTKSFFISSVLDRSLYRWHLFFFLYISFNLIGQQDSQTQSDWRKFSNKNMFIPHEMDKLTVVLMSIKWLNKKKWPLIFYLEKHKNAYGNWQHSKQKGVFLCTMEYH